MSLYVLKFGGSSVATVTRIQHVASVIKNLRTIGDHHVAVVVSAMQGVTNQLVELTRNFSSTNLDREYDAVISSGEQVSSGLLSLCLKNMGINAKSFQGWQIPIITDGMFSDASIKSVDKEILLREIYENDVVPVITGFQGISEDNREIHTIGRGGSDASAVAISYAIDADECFIYTDVDGVYTADPRIVLDSRRLSSISYEEMLELASLGAKVLQSRSVLMAYQCGVKLRVLSSFTNNSSESGETIVCDKTVYIPKDKKIAGIAHNTSSFMVKIFNVKFSLSDILKIFMDHNIKIEFITESYVGIGKDERIISFLSEKSFIEDIRNILHSMDIDYEFDESIGVVSVVGSGIKTDISICRDILSKLDSENIIVKHISITEMSCSVVIPFQMTEYVINILHNLFFNA